MSVSDLHTVTVHRSDAEPALYNARQELAGDPDLPEFRMKIAELFDLRRAGERGA